MTLSSQDLPASPAPASCCEYHKSERLFLALLCVLAVILGWVTFPPNYDWDSFSYLEAIRSGRNYVPLGLGRFGFVLFLKATTLPYLLAHGSPAPPLPDIFAWVRIVQLLVFIGAVLLFHRTTRRMLGPTGAAAASATMALAVPVLAYATRTWTEMYVMFCVVALLAVKYADEVDWFGPRRELAEYTFRLPRLIAEGCIAFAMVMIWEQSVYLAVSLAIPMFAMRKWSWKLLLISPLGIGFGVAAALAFYFVAYQSSDGYRSTVQYVINIYPPDKSWRAIMERASSLAMMHWRSHRLLLVLGGAGLMAALLTRRWGAAATVIALFFLGNAWLLLQGVTGDYHFRRMVHFAPALGLAVGSLVSFLASRKPLAGCVGLAATLLLIGFGNPWRMLAEVKAQGNAGYELYNAMDEVVTQARAGAKPTVFVVGDATWPMHSYLTGEGLSSYRVAWTGEATGLYAPLAQDWISLRRHANRIIVMNEKKHYTPPQWNQVQAALGRFHTVVFREEPHFVEVLDYAGGAFVPAMDDPTMRAVAVEGWYPTAEEWGTTRVLRTIDRHARLVIPRAELELLPKLPYYEVTLSINVTGTTEDGPQSLTVTSHGQKATFGPSSDIGTKNIVFRIPAQEVPGDLAIDVDLGYCWRPSDRMPGNGDGRCLGASLLSLEVVTVAQP